MHDGNGAIPLHFLSGELAPTADGDGVEARLAIVLGDIPRSPHESPLLQTHKARVKSTHIQADAA